jgi:hypothetical protein
VKFDGIGQSRTDIEFHAGKLNGSQRLFVHILLDYRFLLRLDDHILSGCSANAGE